METPQVRYNTNRAKRPQSRLTLCGVPGLGLAGASNTGQAIICGPRGNRTLPGSLPKTSGGTIH
jgi:hypothetical protein